MMADYKYQSKIIEIMEFLYIRTNIIPNNPYTEYHFYLLTFLLCDV